MIWRQYLKDRKPLNLSQHSCTLVLVISSYTVPVKVQTQQPYQLRTYAWCWSIPPKCSRYKIQMKTVFKTEVIISIILVVQQGKRQWIFNFQFLLQMIPKIRTVSECCRGFSRSSNGSTCVPVCRYDIFISSKLIHKTPGSLNQVVLNGWKNDFGIQTASQHCILLILWQNSFLHPLNSRYFRQCWRWIMLFFGTI